MGRSTGRRGESATEPSTHHHHHHHHRARGGALVAECSVTTASPEQQGNNNKPHPFRGLKPRVGSQYQQSKLPKLASGKDVVQSDRPVPDRMSMDNPNCTREEEKDAIHLIENPKIEQHDVNMPDQGSTTVTPRLPQPRPPGYGHSRMEETQRGGLCVHRPSHNHSSSYLSFAHGLVSCLPAAIRENEEGEESWRQDTIQRYGPHANSTSGTKRRNCNKRKRKRSEDGRELETHSSSSKPDSCAWPPLEGDANVLEHLTVRHDGNVQAAKLAVMVDMSGGRASKARRILLKELYSSRFRRPPTTCSQSWIVRLERTYPDLLGDVREDASLVAYPYVISSTQPQLEWETEDMKGLWRSILACGQEMERDLGNGRRLLLSDVMDFLRRAHGLSLPEEAFGTRHLIVEGISDCFHKLLDLVSKARDAQARLMDVLYGEGGNGVDMEAVQKFLDEVPKLCNMKLNEEAIIANQLEIFADWKNRLDGLARDHETDEEDSSENDASTMDDEEHRDDLAAAERLAKEGVTKLAFRSRDLVLLEKRIEKAYRLQDRIRSWKVSAQEGEKVTIKFLSGMVREANRVNLSSPEVSELVDFHRSMQKWVERANVAIRSRVSLSEIESLIDRADLMPLILSEFVDKLCSRRDMAKEWVEELTERVPCPMRDGAVDSLQWMSRMRESMQSFEKRELAHLHDLASEGTRIPVEIDSVKMLLSEIDARNWSVKAKKWIPGAAKSGDGGSVTGVRGKLEDLRDHLEKGETIRGKIALPAESREAWTLDGETELWSIVNSADDWFDMYQSYVTYDSRRSTEERVYLSVQKLRTIVTDMNRIHANIGNVSKKMTRILAQAEVWYEKNSWLLVRCGLLRSDVSEVVVNPVTLDEINTAVHLAETDVSLGLDEARDLKTLAHKIHTWTERVEDAAPKRSQRIGKGRYSKTVRYSVSELVALIDESKHLPIRTDEEVNRLSKQLSGARSWQLHAQNELKDIAVGFHELRQAVDLVYGLPKDFYTDDTRAKDSDPCHAREEPQCQPSSTHGRTENVSMDGEGTVVVDGASQADSVSIASSETDTRFLSKLGGGGSGVQKMVVSLLKDARLTGVYTAEEEATEFLERVSKWTMKSLEYLDSPKDVYDKKSFASFDKFLQAGLELLEHRENFGSEIDLTGSSLVSQLTGGWGKVVADQLVRLEALQAHRNEFIEWSKAVQKIISGTETWASLDEIKNLAEQSDEYPSGSDMVHKVRTLAETATKWTQSVCEILDSEQKLTLDDARELVDEGEKLRLASEELKTLRAALRSARVWSKKVKRSKIDQGGAPLSDVQDLIEEHEDLLITMPGDVGRLKQAMQGYCICRRPYEGFMIGCDGCDEWYHGACIGVSESQAERYDKYLCIRCSTKRAFKTGCTAVVSVVRKWSSDKELKKARQVDAQKHQRKVRKERRDIEKYSQKMETLRGKTCETDEVGKLPVSDEASTSTPAMSTPFEMNPPGGIQDINEKLALTNLGSVNPMDSTTPGNVEGDTLSEQEIPSPELQKIVDAIKTCEKRLEALEGIDFDRRQLESQEDEKKDLMRAWCVRVRSLVVVPSTAEQAVRSRPSDDGTLSKPMTEVLRDAEVVGISGLSDLILVKNAFHSIAWSFQAMSVLAKRPSVSDLSSVVAVGSAVELVEERSFRMMKAILNRAAQWQKKVGNALAPRPNETMPISVELLKDLVDTSDDIPCQLPEKPRLLNVIDDKGVRHCWCGGPHVGSLMVCCDKCNRWHHSQCVGVSKEDSDALNSWVCPSCSHEPVALQQPMSLMDFVVVEEATVSELDSAVAPQHAPIPEKLWPPFGLLGSPEALEALGVDCSSIPDDVAPLELHIPSSFSVNGSANAMAVPNIDMAAVNIAVAAGHHSMPHDISLTYNGPLLSVPTESANDLPAPSQQPSMRNPHTAEKTGCHQAAPTDSFADGKPAIPEEAVSVGVDVQKQTSDETISTPAAVPAGPMDASWMSAPPVDVLKQVSDSLVVPSENSVEAAITAHDASEEDALMNDQNGAYTESISVPVSDENASMETQDFAIQQLAGLMVPLSEEAT